MKPVSEALDLILDRAIMVDAVAVRLPDALRRVLRREAVADMDSPPFDCSAMDGYALRSADAGTPLEIAMEIQAGSAQEWTIRKGECARIFTGAKIPEGADCVLMQEDAVIKEGRLHAPKIGPGTSIRKRGENCRRGDVIVKAGTSLHPTDLAALAACEIVEPLVSRRPRAIHFVTGNELVDPGQAPTGGQIRDSNSILIASLLEEHGVELVHQSRLPDSLETSVQALESIHRDFDVLLISGGASVGDYDFARPLLERAGFEILLHHVNMRPGKPLIFAARGRQLAFGLPGNPVSHAVIFHLMLAPLFAAMTGAEPSLEFLKGRMENDFSFRPHPRETYWPCRAVVCGGVFGLIPLRFQSSGDVTGITGMNALLRLCPDQAGPIKQGDPADFLWLKA